MLPAKEPIRTRRTLRERGDPHREPRHERENAVCANCGAVLHHGRWAYDETRRQTLLATEQARETLCPGCQRAREGLPEGVVSLTGEYLAEHEAELLSTIWTHAKAANRKDPTQRIIDALRDGERLEIWTTTPRLAQKLGRALSDAYKGSLKHNFSRGDRLLRIEWRR